MKDIIDNLFFDIEPWRHMKGSQFFFNVLVFYIMLPLSSNLLPEGVFDYWYLGSLTESRPYAFYFFRTSQLNKEIEYEIESYPHSVIQITPEQQVLCYDMVDYDTLDPWNVEPILEDFDYDEEDE